MDDATLNHKNCIETSFTMKPENVHIFGTHQQTLEEQQDCDYWHIFLAEAKLNKPVNSLMLFTLSILWKMLRDLWPQVSIVKSVNIRGKWDLSLLILREMLRESDNSVVSDCKNRIVVFILSTQDVKDSPQQVVFVYFIIYGEMGGDG